MITIDLATIQQLIDQVLPNAIQPRIERVLDGRSTMVYRIDAGSAVYYLRILPEIDANFSPEALAHRLARTRGVAVPDVVYVADRHPLVDRSVMLTTEIKGSAVGYHTAPDQLRHVVIEAGKALAIINSIPVDGFGWIKRDQCDSSGLQAEFSTYREWIHAEIDPYVDLLHQRRIFSDPTVGAIDLIRSRYDIYFEHREAVLAHGDFDVTHMYHQNGWFSGIIDFGEMRGTDPFYDLGHFNIENSARLPALLQGYQAIVDLPADVDLRIEFASLHIAIGRLGRQVERGRNTPYMLQLRAAIDRTLRTLLD